MSSATSNVIGEAVARLALAKMNESGDGRLALRVTGFDPEETAAALKAVGDASQVISSRQVIVKVGTAAPIDGVPETFLLSEGETLTYWRNRPEASVLLFDWGTQNDEEGLAAVSRINDQSLLAVDSDSDQPGGFVELAQVAWELAGGVGQVPTSLLDLLGEVWSSIEHAMQLSLRRWTQYLIAVCGEVAAAPLRTPQTAESAVSTNLFTLRLFPDPELLASGGALRARLAKNINVSELAQPNGANMSEEDLLLRVQKAELSQASLDRLGVEDAVARERMIAFAQDRSNTSAQSGLDLSIWLEIFDRRNERAGLGVLVRQHLDRHAPQRLPEFDDLDVESGLDNSEQLAAERFLLAEPIDGERPLAEVLPTQLRRKVEKLAFPDAQLEADPLRAFLHAMSVLDDGSDAVVNLKWEGPPEVGRWTRWLFAYLYGRTLTDALERSGLRLALTVADDLVTPRRPANPEDDEAFEPATEWAALRVVVEFQGIGARRFRWDPLGTPGQLCVAALLNGYEVAPGEPVSGSFEEYLGGFTEPLRWPRSAPELEATSYSGRVADLRRSHFLSWGEGLSAVAIDGYLDTWAPIVTEARRRLVPANAPDADLERLVLAETVQLADGNLLMLATHPLRLRWLARHLEHMVGFISKALTDGLDLNGENGELFFDSLERVSPHGTPPIAVGADEVVAIAVRESAGHEEFAPIRRHGQDSREWLATVDDAAIEELVRVISTYLETYPHKMDGLSVLLLDRTGESRLALRLAKRIRAKHTRARFELIVVAPRSSHHEIVTSFDQEFADDEPGPDRLLPDIQLVLREWKTDDKPELDVLYGRADLALAPALFGTRTKLNAKTREAAGGIAGGYDPWIHASAHNLEESSQNVVREMLPSPRDELLETWSTLCVRHETHSAVAPDAETNTDYFEMQVRFDQHQELFLELHAVAHWVVTLDSFIGRDQVDALEGRPDVILVKPRVGKNEASTLIVSSATGEQFVVKQLQRRLSDIGIIESGDAGKAARLYEVGRNIVPGAVLRSLGIGSTVNEIVGLVAARYLVAERYPVSDSLPGVEVWIGFDEQQRWFGRAQRTRADLGRFVLRVKDSGDVSLDVLVVESKFRQAFDLGTAEQQLDRTTALCGAAFRSGDPKPDDRTFWLNELASAIEQTSAIRQPGSELPSRRRIGTAAEGVEQIILSALRGGQVSLDSVEGVAVAVAAADSSHAPAPAAIGPHFVHRVNRPELTDIIASLMARRDPYGSAEGPEVPAPGPERPLPPSQSGEPRGAVAPSIDAAPAPPPQTAPQPVLAERNPRYVPTPRDGGLGDAELKLRYEQLLDVFHHHNVPVTVPSGATWREGPGFYELRVAPKTGVTVDRVISRVSEIALALRLPTGFNIRTSIDRGTIVFEVPKTAEERFPVYAEDLWHLCQVDGSRLLAPIGANIAGDSVQIDFSAAESPHLLVAGTTGSGKSVALETILRGLTRYSPDAVRLRLVDPKGTELVEFEDSPHLDGSIGSFADDAIAILEDAVAEMQRRYDLLKAVRARKLAEYNERVQTSEQLPWLVIVLDEYADLTSDPSDKAAVEALLRRLTQKARAAGIHVIAATQRPSADVISTTIRSNFPAQLALRVRTATDSRIILDEAGAESLAGGGDAILRTAAGLERLQVALAGAVRGR